MLPPQRFSRSCMKWHVPHTRNPHARHVGVNFGTKISEVILRLCDSYGIELKAISLFKSNQGDRHRYVLRTDSRVYEMPRLSCNVLRVGKWCVKLFFDWVVQGISVACSLCFHPQRLDVSPNSLFVCRCFSLVMSSSGASSGSINDHKVPRNKMTVNGGCYTAIPPCQYVMSVLCWLRNSVATKLDLLIIQCEF
jgi:hypothetical protein